MSIVVFKNDQMVNECKLFNFSISEISSCILEMFDKYGNDITIVIKKK